MAWRLRPMRVAVCALVVLGAGEAGAQRGPPGTIVSPRDLGHGRGHGHGFRGGGGFFFVDEVVVEREVVREVPAAPPQPAVAPPEPRKPYVIGRVYASLPGGCMKLIESGASYYICSGDWYRQVGSQYKAVAQP